ncbi:hypothetical protein D9619_000694 [Psilocybe cf. subviscida]|uniref:GATA-type domain-containing protein n=1 Tax=Psilocybe cf. subviscida TaxID=2480587 RepID=A0A8H5BER6_9AGAR|nr:hypothetical protein D9619_000694 [Psilocybe cf. subviscida]
MDALTYDSYTSSDNASNPRTPSPTDMHFTTQYKHDIDHPVAVLFPAHDDGAILVGHDQPFYNQQQQGYAPFPNRNGGSLLQELFEPDLDHHQSLSPEIPLRQDAFHQQSQRPAEFPMARRNTFPYARGEREMHGMPMQQYPSFMQQQHQQQQFHQQMQQHEYSYNEHRTLNSHQEAFSSPHSSYNDFDSDVKLEPTSVMVPSQPNYYHQPEHHMQQGSHPMGMPSYLSSHTSLPVQHTDDAASKETQYLRRRCFNCHTTEPPSWRRSTLNPGKIVCNKCGLYERTHLRPRPLRFDELRAGNKARKVSKAAAAAGSGGIVKQGNGKVMKNGLSGIARRSSISSSTSSVHSGSGASDWDDNVSVYSSGSAPTTSYNSPTQNPFPLSRGSQSPPQDGGIRLPNNPLSDIASMQHHQHHLALQAPQKSHTSPAGYFNNSPSLHPSSLNGSPALNSNHLQLQQDAGLVGYFNDSASNSASPQLTAAATISVGSS